MIAYRGAALQAETNTLTKGDKIKPPSDVLGAIVASQMDVVAESKLKAGEKVQAGLTPEEIVGNVCKSALLSQARFMLMFRDFHCVSSVLGWRHELISRAGHETSAHVIGFTLAYLALYPEHQEKILQEVDAITGGSLPSTPYSTRHGLSLTHSLPRYASTQVHPRVHPRIHPAPRYRHDPPQAPC
jgi:hypothetical protein